MEEKALYDKYSKGKHWEKHPTIYAERFADFLKTTDFQGKILDVGCGSGRDVKVFADNGFQALGVDVSENVISNAKKNHPDLNFELGDAEKLPFDDESADAVFMINLIHYVDKQKAIQEVFRVLKPGGLFFIHFNLSITDSEGNTDYSHDETDARRLVSSFDIVRENKFERIDLLPTKHKHIILELVLKK